MNSTDTTLSIPHNQLGDPAIFTAQGTFTWAEFQERIYLRQIALTHLGLKSGAKCAIFAAPSVDYVETLFGMWMLGIIAVPLNTRLPYQQILKMLEDINCSHLILDTEKFVTNDIQQTSFDDLNLQHFNPAAPHQKFNFNFPATIIFTSGSTGPHKACLHSIGNHVYNALGSNKNIKLHSGDAWLLSLPLYHVAGIAILFRCLLAGAAIAIPAPEMPLEENLKKLQPTHLSLVAAQLQQLLESPDALRILKSTKAILLGGSAIPSLLIKKAIELNLPIFKSYGSTEMASQITTTRPHDPLELLMTSGKVLAHRKIKIGGDGEILVRGKTLFQGFVHGDNIVSTLDSDGWYHTADLGKLDANGYLSVLGRKDNMFISGGENIHPEEIERALEELPHVEQAIVVPVDDEKFGQRPVVFLKVQAEYTLADIPFDSLQSKLARYKIPDHIFEWPDEHTGLKVDRTVLRRKAETLLRA